MLGFVSFPLKVKKKYFLRQALKKYDVNRTTEQEMLRDDFREKETI